MAGYHKVCPDCGETFTKRSFSRHMIKYYDRRHDTWTPHKSPGNVVSSSDSSSTSSPIRDLLELSDSDDSTASHTACIGEKDVTNVFAKVTWFREYQDRYKYGNALQMWFCNKYEESGSSCFMPVERIRSRFSRGITGASKDLMCICPVTRRIISDN
ncbi:hypothetical protein FSP39_008007 [Pinctada imbricata]|uniref:C2H2-type domain-containing protein n=1 Tax=Pinctada imbricata TaxID=66713 RepID=A0AA88YL91_PINIB|nr:hypothetical protein FSP39_008007 [Pinctada imbricata]